MQGDRVEETIIAALDTINARRDDWDVVVIIREAVPLPIFRALIHTTWRQIARSFRCLSLPASVMNATILFLTVYHIHV